MYISTETGISFIGCEFRLILPLSTYNIFYNINKDSTVNTLMLKATAAILPIEIYE